MGPGARYQIGKLLGEGGVCAVRSIFDRKSRKWVAGKFHLEPPELSARVALNAEAEVTRKLRHPNIVRIHDHCMIGPHPYLVMEYIEGVTLGALMSRGQVSMRFAIRVLGEVLKALEHAHTRGVLHLDLKPSNIMLADRGAVKLIDFGVGSAVAMGLDLSSESCVVGTPRYMAPEQWTRESVDERADIWAVGVLLYELVCGEGFLNERVPRIRSFVGRGAAAERTAHRAPVCVSEILECTLLADPQDRIQSVSELRSILVRCGSNL